MTRASSTRTCLIVDDSLVTRKAGRDIVEAMGFRCDEATDGESALEYCRNNLPDAVLLDWNMPRMSGYDFMLALKDLPQGEKPVIIFCTSEYDSARILQAIGHGAHEYIIKPFDSDMVRDKFVLTGLVHDSA